VSPKGGFRVGPDSDPDRYALGPAVASGAEGILYRASITTTSGMELDVAIKMLQPRFLSRVDEWHERWSEQVELLRSLQFPGVVRVRDGFVGPLPHSAGEVGEGRSLYLVMNWVEGEALDEWVRHRPDRYPFDALKLLLPVAAALDLMHSGRATGGVAVVHRDVKPSNIVITDEGSVLVDFGLTRGLPTGQRISGISGTLGYLAPEATDAGIYSPATDRYALGAVAYFVFTGSEPPIAHQSEVLRAALEAAPALAERPEAIDHIMAMLADDPDARPGALANWVGQLRRSSLAPLPEALAPEAPRRHPERRSEKDDTEGTASAHGRSTAAALSGTTGRGGRLVSAALVIAAAVGGTAYLRRDGSATTSRRATTTSLSPTSRPEPRPSTSILASLPTTPRPLFLDDFSESGRWPVRDERFITTAYIDDQYRMVAQPGCFCLTPAPRAPFPGNQRVEVDVRPVSASGGTAFGVECLGSPGQAADYLGLIDTSGAWRISRFLEVGSETVLQRGQSNERPGSDAPVRIAMECSGDAAPGKAMTLRLHVNGQFVGEATDPNGIGRGGMGIGVMAGRSVADVHFDNFTVTKL